MDKNVVAFVRTDAFTLTYKAKELQEPQLAVCVDKKVKAGDKVLIKVLNGLVLVVVQEVHPELQVTPDTAPVPWVVSRVDTEAIDALLAENATIQKTVDEGYARNLQRSFRQQILAGLTSDAMAALPLSVRGE